MSSYKVETIEESVACIAGMHLNYCFDTNSVYWVDAFGGQAQKMDMDDFEKISVFKILGESIFGFCIPIQGQPNEFIVGAGKRLLQIHWDGIHSIGKVVKLLGEIDVDGVRMNHARVDKNGRLFFGTVMDEVNVKRPIDIFDRPRIGGLYQYTVDGGLVQLKSKIGFPNGISWNSSWTKMFFVDSFDLVVYEFDYDIKSGNISNQNVLIDLTKYCVDKVNFPMGMTIDVDDNIFLAVFGVGKVLKINTKTKKVVDVIDVNLNHITGLEFAGKNLDTLLLPTITMSPGPEYEKKDLHGKLIKISNVGTKGVQLYKFAAN